MAKKRFFDIFGESWREYRSNFLVILLLFLLLGVIPNLILGWVGVPMINLDSTQVIDFYKSNQGILYLTVGLAAMFLSALLSACLINLAFNSKKKMKLKETLSAGASFWGGYIFLVILLTVLVLVLTLPSMILLGLVFFMTTLSQGLIIGLSIFGILFFILPLIYFVYWTFAYYALIGENKGIVNSLKRSKEVVKNKWWKVFWYLILMMIILGIISLAFWLVGNAINSVSGNLIVDNSVSPATANLTVAGFFIQLIFSLAAKLVTLALGFFFLKNFFLEIREEKK